MSIKRKISLTVTAVAAVIGLLGYAIILPTWREINGIIAAIQREQEDLESKYQRGQRLRKVASEYKKIKQLRDRLNAVFIPSGDELTFITTLERLKRELGVDAVPTPGQLELAPNDPLPLAMTVRGNFPQAIRYLFALEELSFYYNVATLTINASNPDQGDVMIKLSGLVFRKPYRLSPAAPAEEDRGNDATPAPTSTDASLNFPGADL